MDPNSIKTNKTGKSALGFLLIAVVIAAVVAVFILYPDIFKNVIYVVLVIIIAIIAICVIVWVVMVVLAVPYYAAKGESYQDDMEYNVDDVQPVKETSSDEKNQ